MMQRLGPLILGTAKLPVAMAVMPTRGHDG
jgi:hypothetical protein